MTELRLVKNALLIKEFSVIQVKHYDTIIYSYDPKTQKAWYLKNCSLTSNRQIKYANDFFKPISFKEDFFKEKWGYST